MNGTAEQIHVEHIGTSVFDAIKSFRIVAGGAVAEAIGAAGAVVLCVLGLADSLPQYMLPIAVLAMGVALLIEGASIGSRYSKIWTAAGGGVLRAAELAGGMTAEFLGGAGGIVLGVLALLDIAPLTLCTIATIGYGTAMLIGCGATIRLNYLEFASRTSHQPAENIAREAVSAAAGAQVLVGLAAVALGILSLVGINPVTLTFVALLCVSASGFFSGTALSSRFADLLRA